MMLINLDFDGVFVDSLSQLVTCASQVRDGLSPGVRGQFLRLLAVGAVVLLDSGSGPKYIHRSSIREIAAAIDRRPV